MPFGRPPVAHHCLDAVYRRERQLKQNGNFNSGVFMVRDRKTNVQYIEKTIKPGDVKNGVAYNEIAIMRSLSHRNIVHYIDAFIQGPPDSISASLYMDVCSYGTLDNALTYFARMGVHLPEEQVWNIFMQLVNALGYIHHGLEETVVKSAHYSEKLDPTWRGIVHRDIHPGNVFITKRTTPNSSMPRVLLGDFGWAVHCDGQKLKTTNFTYPDPNWAPVEAPAFGFPGDIWQLGALMQTVCRLDQNPKVYGDISHGRRYRGAGSHYTPQLSIALQMVMHENWQGRPTIMDVARIVQKQERAAQYPREDFPACAFQLSFW